MHSITVTGGLADALGEIALRKMGADAAKKVHAPVLVNVRGGKHHDGAIYQADAPPTIPVRLIKLGVDSWMVQARMGKNFDGNPYNVAGGAVTFPTQDAAKAWLLTEPAGRWKVVLN